MMGSLGKRHTRISAHPTKLGSLASSHPFTQQIDIILPSECTGLENALSQLSTRYARGKVDLARVFAAGPAFTRQHVQSRPEALASPSSPQPASAILALSVNHESLSSDVWCIDTRGVLTACIDKETYGKLGLVGQKLPFKHQGGERYVISLPLHENTESTIVQARRRSALESWDAGFTPNVNSTSRGTNSQEASKGVWDVVYCSTGPEKDSLEQWTTQVAVMDPTIHKVTPKRAYLENIWIPNPSSLPPRPQHHQEDELEDWEADISALFEWIGMAGLHAQRLHAIDRVDPYIALYEPPAASRVGNVVHLRWKGLLSQNFVQSVIDLTVTYLQGIKPPASQSSFGIFVAITVHGITNSPVVYLPRSGNGKSKGGLTAHLPRKDGEDTWCLVLTPPKEGRQDIDSIAVEFVGQWDGRWG